jgi:hypothetical protein
LACLDDFTDLLLLQDHQFLVSRPPLLEEGPLPADLTSAVSEAPEAEENQNRDDAKVSKDDTSSMTSPPPALSEDLVIDKKRKRAKVFASSSASASKTVAGESSVLEDGGELFDFIDS